MEKMFFVSIPGDNSTYSPRVWVSYPENPFGSEKQLNDVDQRRMLQDYIELSKEFDRIFPYMNLLSTWKGVDKSGGTFRSWEVHEQNLALAVNFLKSEGFREVSSEEAEKFLHS